MTTRKTSETKKALIMANRKKSVEELTALHRSAVRRGGANYRAFSAGEMDGIKSLLDHRIRSQTRAEFFKMDQRAANETQIRNDPVYRFLDQKKGLSPGEFESRHRAKELLVKRLMTQKEYESWFKKSGHSVESHKVPVKSKESVTDRKRKLAIRATTKRLFNAKTSVKDKEKLRKRFDNLMSKRKPVIPITVRKTPLVIKPRRVH